MKRVAKTQEMPRSKPMTPPDYRTRIIQTEQEGVAVFYLPDIRFADPNTYPAHPVKRAKTERKP